MLARVSTPLTTRQELTDVGGDSADCGITSPPDNALAPLFRIDCVAHGQDHWIASVTLLRAAAEGNNHAYHLAPGLYSTGLMRFGDRVSNYLPGDGNRQIYIEIDTAHAQASRDAEVEHCNDLLYAFQITLHTVETRVRNATRERFTGSTKAEALKAAVNGICGGLHASLQDIVRVCVNLQSGNVDQPRLQRELVELYLNTAAKTQDRDNRGWHTLRPDTAESWSTWSWIEYAGAKVLPTRVHKPLFTDIKDIRKLIRGPSFQVNVTPSHLVITL